MKNVIIFCCSLVLFMSCKKDPPKQKDSFNDPYYNGTMTATRNGKSKTLKVHAQLDSNNKLIIGIIDWHNDFGWDQFGVYNVEPKIGNFELEDETIWRKTTDSIIKKHAAIGYNSSFDEGWDVVNFSWLRKDRPRNIIIDKYEGVGGQVSGTLTVSFIKDSIILKPTTYDLDTVTYTNATFTAPVWNWKEVKY